MAHAARLVTVPKDPDATEPAPPRPPAGSATYSQGTITERYIHAAQVLFPGAASRGEERIFGGRGSKSGSN